MPVETYGLFHQPLDSSACGVNSRQKDIVIARDGEVRIIQAELDEANASIGESSECVDVCPCAFRIIDGDLDEPGSVRTNAPEFSVDAFRVRNSAEEYGVRTQPSDAGIVCRWNSKDSPILIESFDPLRARRCNENEQHPNGEES